MEGTLKYGISHPSLPLGTPQVRLLVLRCAQAPPQSYLLLPYLSTAGFSYHHLYYYCSHVGLGRHLVVFRVTPSRLGWENAEMTFLHPKY